MAGDSADIQHPAQMEMWQLLGSTAEQLAGGLRSPKSPGAEAPGKSGRKRPMDGPFARNERAKQWTPERGTGPAKRLPHRRRD